MLQPDEFFPDSPRVKYLHSPLVSVIIQVRFPPILRIEGEVPAAFQEAIRGVFPLYERNQSTGQFDQLPPEVAKMLGAAIPQQQPVYAFKSEDESQVLSLSSDSMSLTSAKYTNWEEFLGLFTPAYQALVSLYKPAFLSRIGLRYQNVIVPEQVGIDLTNWSNVLSASLLGEMAPGALVGGDIEEAGRQLRIIAPDRSSGVLLQHGIVREQNTGQLAYLLDTDSYTDQKTEVGNAFEKLGHFNRRAGRAFRWGISTKLHDALGPEPMDVH